MPQHQLHGLRGEAYVSRYKQLYEEIKDDIKNDVRDIKLKTGKFSWHDFGSLCMKYRIPATVMDDYLNSVLPSWASGTWERAGVRAKDVGIVWSDD